ncbi:hypothetical protein ACGFR8_07810 [Streptomyces brevispora]|uniref:hypothetical protein n=1 Tax=Streptomyces brevispora TaxID=887462 RepID=UPI00371FDF55
MPEITAQTQAAVNVAPARCGKGKAIHYATVGRHEVALLCGYRSFGDARLLTDADLPKMGDECTRCVKGVQRMLERVTPTEAPAPAAPAVHRFEDTRQAYDASQGDGMRDGDVLVIESEGVVGFLTGAWPVAITAEHGELHALTISAREVEDGRYATSTTTAERIAREIGAALPATAPAPLDEALAPAAPAGVKSLDQDVTTPATMFDPELTYYADGTPVVMRWEGGEETGATVGMTTYRNPYAYQAVQFEDGTIKKVAPHVLHRVEQAPAEAQPVRHLADYDLARTDDGVTVHRITVTHDGDTVFTTDLPYTEARNAARTLEGLGWAITGMETYGGPHLFRAWVEPTAITEDPPALPFHGPDNWVGLHALCGYDNHTAPLDSPGLAAVHERRRGVMGSCPGSLRPVRTTRDQLTSRHTAALSYTGPKPSALAYWSKPGDVLHVDGQDLTVKDCHPDERHPSRVRVLVTGGTDPLTYTVEDTATFRRRVRRHNVECQACGVYAPVETDEAVDGTPTVRLCGMCDREVLEAPPAPMLMPDQARGIATRSHPGAHDFRHSHDAALRFLGYTFQISEDAPARYGWITPAGTCSRVGETARSSAHQLLPVMVLEDQRAATRAAARAERPAPYVAGDRIVCADGVTRTFQAMAPRFGGEPARVIVEGGAQWLATECRPATPDEEQQPTRRVVEGVVVQPATAGSAPKHVDHPDITAARAALRTLLAARLGERTELDGSDPDVRGYVIEPRGQGRVAVYWAEAGRLVRHDDAEFGVSLDCLEWTLQRAGWETERMTRSGLCLFAHNPAARPTGN